MKSSQSSSVIGYETTFIYSPEVADDAQKTFLDKIKGIIENHNGTVVQVEDWGRRKLAYPIKKETRGAYHYLVYSGDNNLVAEIERNMRINESILRFLTVRLERDFNPADYKKRPTVNAHSDRGAPVVERSFEGGELS